MVPRPQEFTGIRLLRDFIDSPNETLRDVAGNRFAIEAVLRCLYSIEEIFEDLLRETWEEPDRVPEPTELWYIPETDAWGEPKKFRP
jgi:hypothetical protein